MPLRRVLFFCFVLFCDPGKLDEGEALSLGSLATTSYLLRWPLLREDDDNEARIFMLHIVFELALFVYLFIRFAS